ncbi:carboxymuconolactone decarboxylase [Thermopolyspora flexuosa]|uniref:4-carboxymuconolactone decarboxylase n=1 Tax=Thermopolyspora flexuosa TaxID=103836 RepID=A0A543IV90_9ACTN|nr:carboxymuconolactone decarboxylase family protein [Thermopolyspora flexuosa]TQM74493.1 4-carboxymuconolactone decarboxylase [Thermopolyspora flexuosa]GGM76567.1 carboxymuconolactone decarboxylase [Thermopolyspora flexuosa]
MTQRLPGLRPEELDEEQARLYRAITGGPRGTGPQAFALTDEQGRLRGPFNAMLLSPPLGGALQELGAAVRYRSVLSDRIREMAILVVAAHWGSRFEREAHEAVGRACGLTEAELAALREGRVPELADPAERTAVRTTAALAGAGTLTDAEYGEAVAALGERGLFELTTLVGYYATLALQLRVFAGERKEP